MSMMVVMSAPIALILESGGCRSPGRSLPGGGDMSGQVHAAVKALDDEDADLEAMERECVPKANSLL